VKYVLGTDTRFFHDVAKPECHDRFVGEILITPGKKLSEELRC